VQLTKTTFGVLDEREIDHFTIDNGNGLTVSLTNFGGIITSIDTPDRQGRNANIVLGYSGLYDYVKDQSYLGCIVGRYANRIKGGRFKVGGQLYNLFVNDGSNHLHGGKEGFNKRVWHPEPVQEKQGCGVELYYTSADGEEGYPGTVDVQVTYLVTPNNELIVKYRAATDRQTVINLTQHSYFNLAGSGTVLDHLIQINSSAYTPVDKDLVPDGTICSVEGTMFDLRREREIRDLFFQSGSVELIAGGYDHNFVLDSSGDVSQRAASLYHPQSGRCLEMWTTEPGVQFYTANHLPVEPPCGASSRLCKHGAVCLEAQHFPDSPNQGGFPSVILEPGHPYAQVTKYRFGVRS